MNEDLIQIEDNKTTCEFVLDGHARCNTSREELKEAIRQVLAEMGIGKEDTVNE